MTTLWKVLPLPYSLRCPWMFGNDRLPSRMEPQDVSFESCDLEQSHRPETLDHQPMTHSMEETNSSITDIPRSSLEEVLRWPKLSWVVFQQSSRPKHTHRESNMWTLGVPVVHFQCVTIQYDQRWIGMSLYATQQAHLGTYLTLIIPSVR